MKTIVPVALAAALLSACSSLQDPSSHGLADRSPAQAGTAVAELPTTIRRAAETAWAAGDYGAAVTHYAFLYKRDPSNLQYAARYAEAARRSGDPESASQILQSLVSKNPGAATLWIELAKANLQLGRAGLALNAAQEAVAREPALGESHVVLGLALDAVGEHARAASAYQEALAKGAPGSARILNNLALSLAQAGKLNESVETLRKAHRLDSEVAPISQNLNLIEEIAGTQSSPPVKAAKVAAAASVPEIGAERRVLARGITLSDAHRRVPPTQDNSQVPVHTLASFRPASSGADVAQPADPARPDLDEIATTMAAMRGRMEELKLPVAKTAP